MNSTEQHTFNEQTYWYWFTRGSDEVIINGKDQGKIKTTIKCGPCTNGRHYDCTGVGCECKRNNHYKIE